MSRIRSASIASLSLALLLSGGCGHIVPREFAPNHPQDFDLRRPGCLPAPRPPRPGEDLLVRYLGAGGLYLEWRGSGILVSPFFSNPGLLRAGGGRLRTHAEAVGRGLEGMDLRNVGAILVGHAHYDHLADVPEVARSHAPKARIYVNRSGARALDALPELKGRVVSLEGPRSRGWIVLQDGDGSPLPIRFRAVESAHAPQLWKYRWARGGIDSPWTGEWSRRKVFDLREGTTFAFVVDLLDPLDPRRIRFRLYYQDAAAPENVGHPAFEPVDGHPYDLAVLCMPSFKFVKRHPESILGRLRARHVLVTHYEDFFRDPRKPLRFVPPMPDRWVREFLTRVRSSLSGPFAGPEGFVCGPSNAVSTLPLPGEWLRFRVPRG